MTSGAHIRLDHINHRYRAKGDLVLKDIDLEIEPGQAVAIIGRSGCGKSTLLHLVSGLMMPSEGEVWIDGAYVRGPSPKWIMMFQQPSLYPWMSVRENASLGLKFQGRAAENKDKIEHLLEMVDLSAHIDDNVQDLSGGQQQRVALARSLATDPEVLLLDEPFSALDAFTRASLQRDVRAIAQDLGLTLMLVTHSIDEAVIMGDRALVMNANPGRVEADIEIGVNDGPGSDGFASSKKRLVKLFEDTVGERIGQSEVPKDAPPSDRASNAQLKPKTPIPLSVAQSSVA